MRTLGVFVPKRRLIIFCSCQNQNLRNPMSKNQLSFFATKADLESLLRKVETEQRLQYVLTGLFDSPITVPMLSLLNAPTVGFVGAGDPNQSPTYLVADRGMLISARPVPQRSGGVKYAVDQGVNPQTIALQPGGLFGETCLIAGQVGTVSGDAHSADLFRSFSKEIRRQFTMVKSFYIGKEAVELLDKGFRLTANAKSPALYDLKRD